MNITTRVFWTFILGNLAPPLIFLVQILRRELEQMTLFSQKYLTVWNYKNDKYSNSHEE